MNNNYKKTALIYVNIVEDSFRILQMELNSKGQNVKIILN